MLLDMCLLLLGFSWVIQRVWSSPLTTAAASRQPKRDYDCSCRWYTWLLTELAPSTHTHLPHSVSRPSHQATDRSDQSHSCALPSLPFQSIYWPWVHFFGEKIKIIINVRFHSNWFLSLFTGKHDIYILSIYILPFYVDSTLKQTKDITPAPFPSALIFNALLLHPSTFQPRSALRYAT